MSGELAFIEWLKKSLAQHPATRALPIGPGDDCALVDGYLIASDMLLDGVHFDLKTTSPELIGRKALAVNLSDLAAMAATPRSAVISLALPEGSDDDKIARGIMQGIFDLATEFNVAIAGGDTNRWRGPLVINVAVTGSPHSQGSVCRAGAKPGDWICVTGQLGGSLSGHHLSFTPRVEVAQTLHSRYGLHAMIDLSDGLATDLRHILAASHVGAKLERQAIPLRDAAHGSIERGLSDGEDFELCFTVAAETGRRLIAEKAFAGQPSLTKIGEITDAANQLIWDDGSPILWRGYEH